MCVILTGLARHLVGYASQAMDANPDGAGVSWLGDKGGKNVIFWQKGMTSESEVKALLKSIDSGWAILHARIATVGGVTPALTHPFPVEINPDTSLTGESDMVLAHNGHWGLWKEHQIEADDKPWSDSRAMAHALARGTLKSDDLWHTGKVVILSSEPYEGKDSGTVWHHGSWTKLGHGVRASNKLFLWGSRKSYTTYYDSEYWKRGHKAWWEEEDSIWDRYPGVEFTPDPKVSLTLDEWKKREAEREAKRKQDTEKWAQRWRELEAQHEQERKEWADRRARVLEAEVVDNGRSLLYLPPKPPSRRWDGDDMDQMKMEYEATETKYPSKKTNVG